MKLKNVSTSTLEEFFFFKVHSEILSNSIKLYQIFPQTCRHYFSLYIAYIVIMTVRLFDRCIQSVRSPQMEDSHHIM